MYSEFTQQKIYFWSAILKYFKNVQMFLILFLFIAFTGQVFSMSGTYTIDPSGTATSTNYQTINSAISDMTSGTRADGGTANGPGVSGAVLFEIEPGTYTENLVIGNISGASATNTITFDGMGTSNVTVRRTTTGEVILLNGARYVTIKNMTIQSTNTTTGIGVRMTNNTQYCEILDNKVLVDNNATFDNVFPIGISSTSTISGPGNNANHITISGNELRGGRVGLVVTGVNTATFIEDINIINNYIYGFYQFGTYIQYMEKSLIKGNTIEDTRRAYDFNYGLYLLYGENNTYEANEILDLGYFGVYLLYENRNITNTTTRTKIINNTIGGTFRQNNAAGFYTIYNNNLDFYHNTFQLNGSGLTNSWPVRIIYNVSVGGRDARIENNIFYNTAGGTAFDVNDMAAIDEMDYNLYYTISGNLVNLGGTNYQDLDALKAGLTAYNQNSYEEDPNFPSVTDFTHQNPCLIGNPNLGITTDINGVSRATPPVIGAVEIASNLNYDLALVEWLEPLPVIQPGDHDIKVLIRNFGTQTITSADVSYSANNSTPVTVNWTGSLGNCEADTAIFTGSNQFNFNSQEPFLDFKAYTADPNNQTDQNKSNDTLEISMCLAIAGTYTVDPTGNGDFETIQEAVDALKCGVSGPVTFLIEPGIYNETVKFDGNYPGTSSTNTITFDGLNKDSVTVTTSETVTIGIRATRYLTIQNLTIRNTNLNNSVGVHLNNNAQHVLIKNNFIEASSGTSGNLTGILISSSTASYGYGNNANYIRIEDNEIKGGYFSMHIVGSSTTSFITDIEIVNNKMYDAAYYGIFTYYAQNVNIIKNEVDLSNSLYGYYGLYMVYNNNVIVESNQIKSKYFGFYLLYVNYTGPNAGNSTARFVNNMISNGDFTNIYNYLYYVSNIDFYHNSINSFGTGSCCYGLYLLQGTNHKIKNNIFVSEGSQNLIYMNGAGIAEMDYNVYYAKGGGFVNWNNSTYSSLSAWQNAVPQFNENSIEEDPDYLASRDLRIPQNRTYYRGDYTVPVQEDIFGTNRCFYIMGAYEMSIPVSPAHADFLAPDTAYVNSPTLFLNNPVQGEPQYDQWFVDGVFITNDRDMLYIFNSIGVYDVTLVAENCAGDMDTLTQTITVVLPTDPPNADFIANKVNVARGEYVYFTDMSTMGPSSWIWEVIPDEVQVFGFMLPSFNFREGTNNQSRNPVISFPWPGLFTIQLIASNDIGSDTIIKSEYISVGYTMCPGEAPDFTSSSDHKGLLFDDGGDNNYSGSRNCSFLINPCVDTLFLEFDEFEMRCDQDFLRIWDGPDANGKPMHCLDNIGPGFTGGDKICGGSCLPSNKLVLLSGQAYIEFQTASGTPELKGFKMRWYSNEKVLSPQANINVEDTICATSQVDFENVSVGSGLTNFSWHYGETNHLDPATWDAVKHGSHVYSSDGIYTVRLAVEDCEGLMDTLEHDIVVVTRLFPPVIDFSADNLVPMAVRDIVTFDATVTEGCNDTYEWFISTPNNIHFVNGTNANSRSPQVIFDVPGCYDVILHVSNVTGTAVDTKVCYINAWDYCRPYVNTDIASPDDIGISSVSLGNINNHTQMGEEEKYKNFTHLSTSLERGQEYTLTVGRNFAQNPISWAAWIDYDQSREFDAIERIGYEASSNGTQWILTFRVPSDAVLGETRLRIGTNYGNQPQRPCGPHAHGEFHDYTVFVTADVTAPVITLVPPTTVFVQVFYDYVEPGYSAWDDADGDITANVNITSTVNTSIVGAYQVIYDVSDLAGNTATAQRDVIVMDTIWPGIVLLGDDTMYIEVHNQFNEPGVDITDNYYQNIQPDVVSTLDITKLGTYTIQYCATDGSGNGPVCVTRVVVVEDTTPPEVELIGNDTVFVEVYEDFIDPWLNIQDNYWGSNDITVDISGTFIDTDTLNLYYRTYTVTDGSGNVTTITRYIWVVDTTPPVITLVDSSYVVVLQWSEFEDPWVVVTDNFDAEHQIQIFTGGNFTGTQEWGNFHRTYYAVDRSGNVSDMKYRSIYVEPAFNIEKLDENGFGISLYPNPSTGEFNLNVVMPTAIEGAITITDMLGREIKTIAKGTLESQVFEIDMSNEASGIYLIRLETSDRIMIERINIAR